MHKNPYGYMMFCCQHGNKFLLKIKTYFIKDYVIPNAFLIIN